MSKEYYVYPITEGADWTEHNADRLFCDDTQSCPCHEDADNLEQLQEWYADGLIGTVDGDLIWRGKTV